MADDRDLAAAADGGGDRTRGRPLMTAGSDLWSSIVEVGGIEADGWDAPLAAELRERLGLRPDEPIGPGLTRLGTSAEDLVRSFFVAAGPFARMWSDLLSMLEGAGAPTGENAMEIAYHFGSGPAPDVTFDLSQFRKAMRLAMPAAFDLRNVTQDHLWQVCAVAGANDRDSISYWRSQLPDEVTWPVRLPAEPPEVNDDRLQGLLNDVWALAELVLAEMRTVGPNRGDLVTRINVTGATDTATPISLLALLASDYWLAAVMSAMHRAIADPDDAALGETAGAASPERLADRLEAALTPLRNTDDSLVQLTDQLLEYLELPLWRHRYELFSNWVCTRLLAALDDCGPRVHHVDGTIRFRSTGTHLATFDGLTPRLHLWTELQTPLDNPRGTGRKANIRPDISLVEDPVTEPSRTPVVVECKQYKKANNADFADAVADYANGRPNALVVLADHGPVKEDTVLAHLGDDAALAERISVIGGLALAGDTADAALANAVRGKLGLDPLPSSAPDADELGNTSLIEMGDDIAVISLLWEDPNTDLDLHVTVAGLPAGPSTISYLDWGNPEVAPFVYLRGDIRAGGGQQEIVGVRRVTAPCRYTIEVHRFGSGKDIAAAGAVVEIIGANGEVERFLPNGHSGRWEVATFGLPASPAVES